MGQKHSVSGGAVEVVTKTKKSRKARKATKRTSRRRRQRLGGGAENPVLMMMAELRKLEAKVVADGVVTQEQLDKLEEIIVGKVRDLMKTGAARDLAERVIPHTMDPGKMQQVLNMLPAAGAETAAVVPAALAAGYLPQPPGVLMGYFESMLPESVRKVIDFMYQIAKFCFSIFVLVYAVETLMKTWTPKKLREIESETVEKNRQRPQS